MRVIAGEARSVKLIATAGMEVRPTTDRTKETLFNMINPHIFGAIFLDIFSGSGAIGIEALSRGAKKCYLIENDKEAYSCIEQNLKHTKLEKNAELLKQDYLKALYDLKDKNIKFDIVFLDPPYNKGLEEKTITYVLNYELLLPSGLLVCESDINTTFDFLNTSEYEVVKVKEFRTNKFTFIQKKLN